MGRAYAWLVAVGLAVALVGVGVFAAVAALADRTRRRPRVALTGLTVLVPLGLGVGLGWSEFSDKVVQDAGEGLGPLLAKPETSVYFCSPPFEDQPRVYVGLGSGSHPALMTRSCGDGLPPVCSSARACRALHWHSRDC